VRKKDQSRGGKGKTIKHGNYQNIRKEGRNKPLGGGRNMSNKAGARKERKPQKEHRLYRSLEGRRKLDTGKKRGVQIGNVTESGRACKEWGSYGQEDVTKMTDSRGR